MRGHWRRLLLQIGIGATMLTVNAISTDLYVGVVSVSLVVAPVVVWTVFGVLLWLSNLAPEIDSLRERVDDFLTAGMASTVAAIIGVIVLLRIFKIIDQQVGSLITVGLGYIVVAVMIPAVAQLRTVRDVWLPMVALHRVGVLPTNDDVEDARSA